MQTLLKVCSNGGFLGLEEVMKLCGETFRTRQGTSNRGRFQEPQRRGGHQEPQRWGASGTTALGGGGIRNHSLGGACSPPFVYCTCGGTLGRRVTKSCTTTIAADEFDATSHF